MTGQYISLTPAQEKAFRSQATRIAQEGDEAFVRFIEADGNEVYLECEELADIAAQAAQIYDRLMAREEAERTAKKAAEARQDAEQTEPEAKTEVTEKSEAQANWERRQKIAGIFRVKGFEEAAKAVTTELCHLTGKEAGDVSRTLCRDIPLAGLFGWAKHYAYLHANSAKELADGSGERMAMIFIAPLLWVWKTLSAGEELSTRTLQLVADKFGEARPAEQWAPWALKAMERLIVTSHPDLYEVCIELADEVKDGLAEHRGASALINGMMTRVPGLLSEAKKKIAREKAEKESARRARQSERAMKACAKKSSKK